MISLLLIGCILVAISVLLQAYCTLFWLKKVSKYLNERRLNTHEVLKLLILSFLVFSLLHFVQTAIWALGYYYNPLTTSSFNDYFEALYFSMVTFTTLGYGDITLNSNWRLLSGFEAINGIMLIGWTTAMMYSLLQKFTKKYSER
ncbi:potassium channel family protein [Mangrovimonas sp. ST2L15]|uniref:potassium channel family protein n=1 Tax=Mangrovimonas sp. ST2L15 TaxID=1645916 RepID=UPI0006B4FB01|nr:potassium channel family protein [Mangrovimonas sp. ST2L15]